MNYELAKKLKEAGFIPKFSSGLYFDKEQREKYCNVDYWSDGEKTVASMPAFILDETNCYIPLLSELIEACVEKFTPLSRFILDNRGDIDKKWVASCTRITPMDYYGLTPEEAVANLWLALNKK